MRVERHPLEGRICTLGTHGEFIGAWRCSSIVCVGVNPRQSSWLWRKKSTRWEEVWLVTIVVGMTVDAIEKVAVWVVPEVLEDI